jgi:hypothetical protein
MACECSECAEYGGPDPKMMGLRFGVFGLQMLVGIVGMLKARSWKALGALAGGFALFATIPRYLICCRCAGYGNMCYSL